MADFNFFIPFQKIDLLSEDECIVSGIATDETPDAEGEVTDYDATKEACIEFSKWRNIREMHGASAVGVAETITLDDLTRSMQVTARIVGREPVKKLRLGVYKGFSIGGSKLAPPVAESRAGKIIKRIIKYMLTEISLVDRPANPSAIFTMVKRDSGGDMKDQLKKWLQAAKALTGGDALARELEAAIKKADDEMPPPAADEKPADAETAKAEGGDLEATPPPAADAPAETPAPAEKADAETQPPAATDAPTEELPTAALTSDQVRELVMAVLLETGLVRQMEGGAAEAPFTGEIQQMKKSLTPLTKFQEVIGDIAKVVSAVEAVNARLETVEKSQSQSGPVLRELGNFALAGLETSLLEKMVKETTDPAQRQALGLALAQQQIKAATGNQISIGSRE